MLASQQAHQGTSVEPGELLRTTLLQGLWTRSQKTQVLVPDMQFTEQRPTLII